MNLQSQASDLKMTQLAGTADFTDYISAEE